MVKMILYSQLFKNLVARVRFDPIFAFNSFKNIRVGLAAHSYVFKRQSHPLVWPAKLTHMSKNTYNKWDILVTCFTHMATGTRHHVWQCLIRVIT